MQTHCSSIIYAMYTRDVFFGHYELVAIRTPVYCAMVDALR